MGLAHNKFTAAILFVLAGVSWFYNKIIEEHVLSWIGEQLRNHLKQDEIVVYAGYVFPYGFPLLLAVIGVVIFFSKKKDSVNYKYWDNIDPLRIRDAAHLWVGRAPPQSGPDVSDQATQIRMILHDAVYKGELPVASENDGTKWIARKYLQSFAEQRGEKPKFLFAKRKSNTARKEDQAQRRSMTEAARLLYEELQQQDKEHVLLVTAENSEMGIHGPLSFIAQYILLNDVQLYGKRLPSPVIAPIDEIDKNSGSFENDGNDLVFPENRKYVDIEIDAEEFNRVRNEILNEQEAA